MRNRLYALVGAVILLAVLLGAYIVISGRNEEASSSEAQDPPAEEMGNKIVDGKPAESFTLKNENGEFEFVKKGDEWSIKGYDSSFSAPSVSEIASVFTGLYSERVIEGEELSKYGLDKPAASASDGNVVINAGTVSSDGKYYYVSLDGGEDVYMVNSSAIQPLFYGLNDLIDKSVQKVNTDAIRELSIDFADDDGKNRDIYIAYDKDDPLAREYAEKNGLAALVMQKPIKNMLVYPYNLQSSVLKNASSLNIKDLADIAPEDLGKYGLDKPKFTLYMADDENSIKITAGNTFTAEEGEYAYVLVNGRKEVFTMDQRALEPFENARIADFAEKFISIYQRSKVNEIDIEGAKSYKIEFKAEGENDFREEDGATRDYRSTYINGKLIEKDVFTDFYELIVGIGFDDIAYGKKSEGKPELTITFKLADGSSDKAEYYRYNDSFYAVTKGGDTVMYVSEQTVRRVMNTAEELSK